MTNDGQPPPKKTRQSTSEEATPSPKTQSATSSAPKSPRMGMIPEMVVKPFDIEGSAYYNPELSLKDEKVPHSASSFPHTRSGPKKTKKRSGLLCERIPWSSSKGFCRIFENGTRVYEFWSSNPISKLGFISLISIQDSVGFPCSVYIFKVYCKYSTGIKTIFFILVFFLVT